VINISILILLDLVLCELDEDLLKRASGNEKLRNLLFLLQLLQLDEYLREASKLLHWLVNLEV
jgi:hypothetical protein